MMEKYSMFCFSDEKFGLIAAQLTNQCFVMIAAEDWVVCALYIKWRKIV